MTNADNPFGPNSQILVDMRADLLRFARLQLRDEPLAEDIVQETVMAALKGQQGFSGRAAIKTWVFSILRHKIVDAIRQRSRTINLSSFSEDEESLDQAFESMFKPGDHWTADARPADWGNPEQALRQEQFWAVFEACLTHLPEKTARVFMMREFLEFETAEVCTELKISTSNCNVILHRARNGLRHCLERSWFVAGDMSC